MTLSFFMLDNISGGELFIILFTIYVFFGVKVIPNLFRSFRKAWINLQDALHEIRREVR